MLPTTHAGLAKVGAFLVVALVCGCGAILGVGDLPGSNGGAGDSGADGPPSNNDGSANDGTANDAPGSDAPAAVDASPDSPTAHDAGTDSPTVTTRFLATMSFAIRDNFASVGGGAIRSSDAPHLVFPVFGCAQGADVAGHCCFAAIPTTADPAIANAGDLTFSSNGVQLARTPFTPSGYASPTVTAWDSGATLHAAAAGGPAVQPFAGSVVAPEPITGLSIDPTTPIFYTDRDTSIQWTPGTTAGAKILLAMYAVHAPGMLNLTCIADDSAGQLSIPQSIGARLAEDTDDAGFNGWDVYINRYIVAESTGPNADVRTIASNGTLINRIYLIP